MMKGINAQHFVEQNTDRSPLALEKSAIIHKLIVSQHMLFWTFFLVLVRRIRVQSLSATFSYTLHVCGK
jgi:hypothetical protein